MRALFRLSCLLLASAPAWAGQVYKWKDANGVTQYSENPPADRTFETRRLTRDPGAPAAPAATPPALPAQCITARANLALLDGGGQVMQDTDGDGTADSPLSDDQRSRQRTLAEAAIRAYCPVEP